MIKPVTAIATGTARVFTWRGRATRRAYWLHTLGVVALTYGLLLLVGLTGGEVLAALTLPVILLLWSSLLSATVRRLHDTGRGGEWVWVALVPLIGGLWLLLLMTEPPMREGNRYSTPQDHGTRR